jgi:steroid delta-isomerase
MPTKEHIQQLIESYVAAVGDHDLEAVLAVFAEDAVQEDPIGAPPNEGKDAIRAFFERSFAGDFTTELTGPILINEPHAAFHFTITVNLGEGDPLIVRAIDALRVNEDGLIQEMRAYVG